MFAASNYFATDRLNSDLLLFVKVTLLGAKKITQWGQVTHDILEKFQIRLFI